MMNTEIIQAIKAEIERRIKELNKDKYISADAQVCRTRELNYLLRFISTLESEKPMQEGLEEEIERYLSTEWELDEDLNKDAPIYIYDCTWDDLKILARHFAKWGAEHFRDTTKMISGSSEIPNNLEEAAEEYIKKGKYLPEGFVVRPAFIAGAKWDREQMMKEAVEGTVMATKCGDKYQQLLITDWNSSDGLHNGDKVRIIIVKEN